MCHPVSLIKIGLELALTPSQPRQARLSSKIFNVLKACRPVKIFRIKAMGFESSVLGQGLRISFFT